MQRLEAKAVDTRCKRDVDEPCKIS